MIFRKLFSNSLFVGSYFIVQKIGLFIFYIILARTLGDTAVGKFAFASSFVFLFTMFADFGLGTLLVKDVARNRDEAGKYLSNVLSIRVLFSIIVMLLIIFATQLMDLDAEKLHTVYILGISGVVAVITGSYISVFRAHEEMQYESLLRIIKEMIIIGPVVFLLLSGYDLVTIALSFLIGNLITLFLSGLTVRMKYSLTGFKIKLSFCKQLLKYAFPFALNTIAISFFIRVDTVMLSMFKGDAVTGWYNIAHTLVYGLLAIPFIYSIVIFPVMSRYYKRKDYLRYIFEKSIKIFLVLGIGIGVIGFTFSEQIILGLYGQEFFNSILVLKIMIWVCILLFFRYIYMNLLGAMDKQVLSSKILISMAIINIILNTLLIPQFSYLGAIFATFITEIFGVILGFYMIYKNIPNISVLITVGKSFVLAVLFLFLVIVLNMVGLKNNLLLALPVYCCSYLGIVFLLKVFDEEEINLLKTAFTG